LGAKGQPRRVASAVFVSALGGAAFHVEALSLKLAERMEPALVLKYFDDLSRGRNEINYR
jgi:hypothetical protein